MNGTMQGMRFALAEIPVPMVYATYRIIRDCNQAFAELFGYGREELLDQSFAILYPKHADFVRTGKMWRTHLSGGKVYFDERVMTAGDGKRFWCQVHGKTRQPADPFAQAIYCYQPIARPVQPDSLALTDRQRQILTLVVQGKTNGQIADETGLSVRTVESHRYRLMKSANVKNAAEMAAWFQGSG